MTSLMRTGVSMMRADFAALILTHGRPDNVLTYGLLRKQGYTGRIVLVIDNEDATGDEYRRCFGGLPGVDVVEFDKLAVSETFDTADNQDDRRTIVYARNASFDIARDLGLRYFIQLDDDYIKFDWRFTGDNEWVCAAHWPDRTPGWNIKSLDVVFDAFLSFLQSTPTKTIAMSQGGDFIGGPKGRSGRIITLRRKAMNSFFCDVERPVGFVGRINEDVNTYTRKATTGDLFFTFNFVSLNQVLTQQSDGGMSEVYRGLGTYTKSFYSVMFHPSGVHVAMLSNQGNPGRLHHSVNWDATSPKIVRESLRRVGETGGSTAKTRALRIKADTLDEAPRKALRGYLERCRAAGCRDVDRIEALSRQMTQWATASKAGRLLIDLDSTMLDRWYESLAAGSPDFGVYADEDCLAEMWSCWSVYSRKYLRQIRKDILPTISGIEEVVDLGCGVGYTTSALVEMFPEARVFGTNFPGTVQTKLAQRLGDERGFSVVDDVSVIRSADLVFASEYFEHIEAPIDHLREVLVGLSPRHIFVANAFGTRSVGHFERYLSDGKLVSPKTIKRAFVGELVAHNYERVKTGFWNDRPRYWRRRE